MTAVKLHPEVSTLIQQPHKHTAHKKPLAIFITAATHWASARETILLHLYKKKASESDSLHKRSALMLLFQTTAVWGLIIIKLCFFSGVLVNDFQIAVNIRSEQFFGPVGESKFKRFATSLAQVLTRWEVSCLSALPLPPSLSLSLSLSHPISLDREVKFCSVLRPSILANRHMLKDLWNKTVPRVGFSIFPKQHLFRLSDTVYMHQSAR